MNNHNHNHGDHESHEGHHAHMVVDFKRRFWISLVFTIPVLLLSPLVQSFLGISEFIRLPGEIFWLFIFSSIIFFYGGWPFLKGLYTELTTGKPGMMTLIGIAITTAYVYSSAVVFGVQGTIFFWELVTLVDVMLLGHWIEMRSIMGASRALEELARLMPSTAHKVGMDGKVEDVPVDKLKSDDKVLIKPGEKIPADGGVIEGESSVNEALLTGESIPVFKSTGDKVIGGSVNGDGSLTVEVKKLGKESYLAQVINLVQQAQKTKSKTQDLANRAALWLTIIGISAGILTLFVWLTFTTRDFAFALERTVTVMVITCPHALGLAVPLVVAVSTALSARNGLLIRNRMAFEKARDVDVMIFDKTGTLTKGEFGVTDVVSLGSLSTNEVLKYAASLEEKSQHPIAKAITVKAEQKLPVKNFKALHGRGVSGQVEGKNVLVVSPGYLDEHNIQVDIPEEYKRNVFSKTTVFLVIDDSVEGMIALADEIREESKQAVAKLKELGIKTIMLTGDSQEVSEYVAEELGIDEYFAEVLPDKKVDIVREVQEGKVDTNLTFQPGSRLNVGMVGDGINDAPALAQADVGIAIGAGTDVAIETADIILVKNNPLDVVKVMRLAGATYKKMVTNLIYATGYNVVAIPLAAGVLAGAGILLSPAVGAILMSASTVVVAVNARFLKV